MRRAQHVEAFRRGRRPGLVAWHDVVRGLVERDNLTFPRVWVRLRALGHADHDVIEGVVDGDDDPSCREIPGQHPPGPHLHWRDPGTNRLRPLSAGRFRNFVGRARTRARRSR